MANWRDVFQGTDTKSLECGCGRPRSLHTVGELLTLVLVESTKGMSLYLGQKTGYATAVPTHQSTLLSP